MSDKRILTLDIMTTTLLWKMQHIVVLHSDTFFFLFELYCHLQMFKNYSLALKIISLSVK